MEPALLEMKNISKRFPGVQALQEVDLAIKPGEVHALLGENGAGKSTLLKIISGDYQPDSGQVFYKGAPVNFLNPGEAQRSGITMIYQECNLVQHLTVAENIYLGNEPRRIPGLPFIDRERIISGSQEVLDRLNLPLDPCARVVELSTAEKQMVEIARALHSSADLVILDEPTAVLSTREVADLFSAVRSLRAQGVTVIYVSHRLEEVLQICDSATILRDGRMIATLSLAGRTVEELIRLMLGRSLYDKYPRTPSQPGAEILRVENLAVKGSFHNISLHLREGEILGITGLVGAGGTALLNALFGATPPDGGQIYIDGEPVTLDSPQAAIARGIGFLTENRQEQGMVPNMSAKDNMTLAALENAWAGPLIKHEVEGAIATYYAGRMQMRREKLSQKALYLSGGNQQKIILSRWLATNSRILLFDEPTQGIDIGARVEIYRLMDELVSEGLSIIMVSSDVQEIIGMSDRVLVLYKGHLAATLPGEAASQSLILAYANGKGPL